MSAPSSHPLSLISTLPHLPHPLQRLWLQLCTVEIIQSTSNCILRSVKLPTLSHNVKTNPTVFKPVTVLIHSQFHAKVFWDYNCIPDTLGQVIASIGTLHYVHLSVFVKNNISMPNTHKTPQIQLKLKLKYEWRRTGPLILSRGWQVIAWISSLHCVRLSVFVQLDPQIQLKLKINILSKLLKTNLSIWNCPS